MQCADLENEGAIFAKSISIKKLIDNSTKMSTILMTALSSTITPPMTVQFFSLFM
jgi:hypothetical protein